MHRLLNQCDWDADEVLDYVVEHLGDPEAVLTVDGTGLLKKGVRSAGGPADHGLGDDHFRLEDNRVLDARGPAPVPVIGP